MVRGVLLRWMGWSLASRRREGGAGRPSRTAAGGGRSGGRSAGAYPRRTVETSRSRRASHSAREAGSRAAPVAVIHRWATTAMPFIIELTRISASRPSASWPRAASSVESSSVVRVKTSWMRWWERGSVPPSPSTLQRYAITAGRSMPRMAAVISENIDAGEPSPTGVAAVAARNSSTAPVSTRVHAVMTTSSSDEKWLKTVRRETSARSASSSTLKRGAPRSAISASAASTIASRCFALRAARRSGARVLMVTCLH
jgi:hypothetical protein